MKAVLKLGGSVAAPDGVDSEFIKQLAGKIKEWNKNHELVVVVGAGALSRKLDKMARELTSDENLLDQIGIYVARLNASVLICALEENACTEIPRSENEFLELTEKCKGKIIVSGGFRPGQRTDAVAVEIAKVWGAEIVIKGTDVDYVYDKDPDKFDDAKPIETLSFKDLQKLGDQEHKANSPTIIDRVAAEMLVEEKIKLAVVNGKDLDNLEMVLQGKEFKGTRVGF